MNKTDDLRDRFTGLRGRVGWVGLGNPAWSDDGFGVRLATALARLGVADVVVAGNGLEAYAGRLATGNFDHLVFLDAVEFGESPGAVIWLSSGEIVARFPQVSTHKIGLGVLARLIESNHRTRCWLLGCQPASLRDHEGLTPAVRQTLDRVLNMILQWFHADTAPPSFSEVSLC